ncbi:protein Frey 1 isoform X2 [Arvicanthis niloticus]|uniref:protein Frey 1 isoform X2 n=1 Tax=Arvicanthis niloticus TaxID=61156 RepID=UPI00402BEA95
MQATWRRQRRAWQDCVDLNSSVLTRQASSGCLHCSGLWCHAVHSSSPAGPDYQRKSVCMLCWGHGDRSKLSDSTVAGALLRPQPQRSQRSVPEEFSAPLELLQPLSGLVDDYGVRPKHPWPSGPRPLLSQAQQRKRDGPNMADYYYDVNL